MKKILINEVEKERCNAQALAAFNATVSTGDVPTPQDQGFGKVAVSELAEILNKTNRDGFRFNEWQKGDVHRIYINGGSIYDTGKVKQNAYIDVKTGNVSVFTNSNQPYNWNITQSEKLKAKLQKYGRYIRRYKQ